MPLPLSGHSAPRQDPPRPTGSGLGESKSQSPATRVNKRGAPGGGVHPKWALRLLQPDQGHPLHSSGPADSPGPCQGDPDFPSPPTTAARCCPTRRAPTSSPFLHCRHGWAVILSTHMLSVCCLRLEAPAWGGQSPGPGHHPRQEARPSRVHRLYFLASNVMMFLFLSPQINIKALLFSLAYPGRPCHLSGLCGSASP